MARSTPIIRDDVDAIVDELGTELAAALGGSDVLVTGGGGFLCSYLVDVLVTVNDRGLGLPIHVTALDNHSTGLPERLEHLAGRPDVTRLTHDVTQPYPPDRPAPDWVVHGASIASPVFYRRFPLETLDANVSGTRRVLEAAGATARGVLVLSTSEIYGDPDADNIPTPETYRGNVSCTGPRACYDESKRLAETLCFIAHQQWGTRVMAARPFNVFGPGQRLDDRRLMPDLLAAALEGRDLVLHSDGRATRALCYVSDAVRALLMVLLRGRAGEAYNIGNDEAERSVREIAETVGRAAGHETIRFVPSDDPAYLSDNPQRRCPDLTKLRHLGFVPRVTVEDAIARTLASYRAEVASCR